MSWIERGRPIDRIVLGAVQSSFCARRRRAPFPQSDVAIAARGRQTRNPEDPCTQSSRPAVSSTASKSARSSRSSSSTSSRARRSPSIASCSSPTATSPRSAGRSSPTRRSAPRSSRQTRGPKLISFKYRPKARSRVKKGHRQELTVLRIADITLGGKSAAKAAKKADDEAKTERTRLEEAAAAQAAKDAELAAKLAVGPRDAEPRPRRPKTEPPSRTTATKANGRGRPPRRPKTDGQGRSKTATKAAGTEEDDRQGRRPTPTRRQGEGGRAEEAPRHEEGRVDEMAHKKAGGSVKNGRDSVGQRLGVKAGDGQLVQRRLDHRPPARHDVPVGPGTGLGHDYTVFATVTGKVKFEHATKSKKRIRVEAVETTAASA